MKICKIILLTAFFVLLGAGGLWAAEKEVILLKSGDVQFDVYNIEKIITTKTGTGRFIQRELYFRDGKKLIVTYNLIGKPHKKVLYSKDDTPLEIIILNSRSIPVKAVFFSGGLKTTVVYTRTGLYKKVITRRL